MLSQKALWKFIDRWEQWFGVRLSEEEALPIAEKFLKLYHAVYGTADIYTK